MNHLIKTFLVTLTLSISYNIQAQKYSKETIYIKFEKKQCDNNRKLKFYRDFEKGLIFNLSCTKDGSFLFKSDTDADTLDIKNLAKYKIVNADFVKKRLIEIRKQRSAKNSNKLLRPMTKNNTFKTHLIEIISEDKFVIYPVIWRNEGAEQ
jgi:hypothetical protein